MFEVGIQISGNGNDSFKMGWGRKAFVFVKINDLV